MKALPSEKVQVFPSGKVQALPSGKVHFNSALFQKRTSSACLGFMGKEVDAVSLIHQDEIGNAFP